MNKQNIKLDTQNDLMRVSKDYMAFEQTSRFREILLPSNNYSIESPRSDTTLFLNKMPPKSKYLQIAKFASGSTDIAIYALIPLLYDDNSTVSCGALLAINKIIEHNIDKKESILKILEEELSNGVNLSNLSLSKEFNISNLAGTNILRAANFRNSAFIDIVFDNFNLKYAKLGTTYLSTVEFRNCNLSESKWPKSNILETRFKASDLSFSKFDSTLFFTTPILHISDSSNKKNTRKDEIRVIFEKTNLYMTEFNDCDLNKVKFDSIYATSNDIIIDNKLTNLDSIKPK